MPRKQIRLTDDHKRFIDDKHIRLSSLIRDTLDNAIEGERALPERTRRNTFHHDLVRTSVSIDEDHVKFIEEEEFVFTIFIHDVIEERIEFERQLGGQ